ncbi:hypothetical protein [Oceanobacillus jeddahense]
MNKIAIIIGSTRPGFVLVDKITTNVKGLFLSILPLNGTPFDEKR